MTKIFFFDNIQIFRRICNKEVVKSGPMTLFSDCTISFVLDLN